MEGSVKGGVKGSDGAVRGAVAGADGCNNPDEQYRVNSSMSCFCLTVLLF